MTEPFIGEIQLYAFDFAPYRWATCNGQIVPLQQNTALFSLLGTLYGGNGTSNFALPNFGGNAGNSQGQGPGLSPYTAGETLGSPQVTLLSTEMPAHTHTAQIYMARGSTARIRQPVAGAAVTTPAGSQAFVIDGQVNTLMSPMCLSTAGSTLPHDNMQPYLTLNYSIALQGNFPSFN